MTARPAECTGTSTPRTTCREATVPFIPGGQHVRFKRVKGFAQHADIDSILAPTVSFGSPDFSASPAGSPTTRRVDPQGQSEQAESWRQIAAAYHAVGLSTIYLVRGSVGLAAADTLDALARTFPPAKGVLRRAHRELADSAAGDGGTFTQAYAREFERSLGAGGGSRIAVRLVEWSDENNHLGRADAAVRLVALLAATRSLSDIAC